MALFTTHKWTKQSPVKIAAAVLLPMLGISSFIAFSQSTPPPLIDLSPEPLYAKGANDKPTLALALSVEFPTVGAQYVDQPSATSDATYAPTIRYVGYFDTESCYQYVNDASAELRRFDRTGVANSRTCGGTGFSGNFMNWATSSAVDVLRLGLTGGDRVVDTSTTTILQRAILPAGRFWNDSNFPSKRLTAALADGAVPTNLRRFTNGTAYNGDIFIANCLNRVHFGTEATGNCDNPGNNSVLGLSSLNQDPRSGNGFTRCAGENGSCARPSGSTGNWLIVYGADNGSARGWVYQTPSSASINCNNATFGDPVNGVVKECWSRASTANWPSSTNSGLTSDSFFYTRVQVCNTNTSGVLQDPRTNFCLRYPSGNYKPVGNMQKYSDRVRVAAFGYLMDDQQSRYGGVLRAPMKYVGPKTFDSTGNLVSSSNPNIEWNESNGIFVVNPDSQSEGKSGVINYLNQFGRTGSTFGRYKTYDPVGELYYETLRYLQGLPPTAQALTGMTDDMKQGFPVFPSSSSGTWTDPHAGGDNTKNYACLKNNILVIGDVNTHNDKSIPGNTTRLDDFEFSRTANTANNEPNFVDWTRVVGGFESNTAVNYVDGSGATRTTSNPNGSTGEQAVNSSLSGIATADTGATRAAYYMAGMAYWANTHDIRGSDWSDSSKRRPGMRVSTYVLDVNEFAQDSVKSTRRSRQFFLAGKYGGFKDIPGKGNPYLDKNGVLDNSSWQKSDDPGEAKNYFLSSNAEAVLQALDNIFVNIAAQGSSIAGSAVPTSKVDSRATGYTYRASFDPADWSGDVSALPITVSANNVVSVGDNSSAAWQAAGLLNNKVPATRNIYVGLTTPSAAAQATSFVWSDIEDSLKASLNKPSPSLAADNRGELRLNYLRGDRSQENTLFRKRGSVLGDIVNSAISFSGAPTRAINESSYSNFYQTYQNRTNAIFVGANDGMLHAFNANNGNELFGYIPSWVGTKLSYLTNGNYNTSGHQSFVDGSSDVREAQVGDAWKTVLVGATGAGGQGVYALDVSDPTAFSASKVMWEFTDKHDADLGNVVGRPQILKIRVSAKSAAPVVYKYFAVFASGVNNYAADGYASTSGIPVIFLLDLSKSANASWELGSNYFKIPLSTNTTATLSSTKAPGALNFEAKGSSAGEMEQLYVGDLHGNMWKLDFNGATRGTTDWNLTVLSPFNGGSPARPLPLYIAKSAAGIVQPISMKPSLSAGPEGATIVLFGTGKYLESTDNVVNSSTQVQSFYAVWDIDGRTDNSNPSSAVFGRSRLIAGTVASGGSITVPDFVWGRPKTDGDTSQRSGWYIDFTQPGERQVSTADMAGNMISFSSAIPPDAAADSCGKGTGGYYYLNIATGDGKYITSTVGILGPPNFLDVGDAVIGKRDSTGRTLKTVRRVALIPGSSGTMVSPTVNDSYLIGRLSWRQINNYYELKARQ